MVYFADSSALVRAYLEDEPGHRLYADLLYASGVMITSALATVEVPRALIVAHRARRIPQPALEVLLDRLRTEIAECELIHVIPLDPEPTLARAVELVGQHSLGTLDAIHLAVADREGRALAGDDELVFVTADVVQGQAAAALGMTVRP